MRYSRVLSFLLFTFFYALGNLGGNYVGWDVILQWFEVANGTKTIDPLFTSPIVLACLAILPSVGQWWSEWHGAEGREKWVIYAIMAADLGINTIGFYYLVMGEFSFPPVWGVFVFLSALAFIPNVFCQSLATLNLKKMLDDSEKRQSPTHQKRGGGGDKKPSLPPASIMPAMMNQGQVTRRTNGAVPLDIEEIQL